MCVVLTAINHWYWWLIFFTKLVVHEKILGGFLPRDAL